MIGWTTLPTKEDAQSIIKKLVELDLVACGQVSGPLESYYKWNNKLETDIEWRVTLKYSKEKDFELSQKLDDLHPYDVPQWTRLEAETTEGYKLWINNQG